MIRSPILVYSVAKNGRKSPVSLAELLFQRLWFPALRLCKPSRTALTTKAKGPMRQTEDMAPRIDAREPAAFLGSTRLGWRWPSTPHCSANQTQAAVGKVSIAALLVTALVLACSGEGGAQGGFGSNGVIRIGYSNEAPFAYVDTQSGDLTGESVVVTRHILAKMGFTQVEGVITEFASLIPGLQAGRFDVIAAGMWITPLRCRQIHFSEPLSCTPQGFIVKQGNPLDLHSYEDVARHPNARLGVVAGGIELSYARAVGIPDDRLSIFPDVPSAFAGLQAGRVDANAGPVPTHKDMLNKAADPGLARADPFYDPVVEGQPTHLCSGIGFRKQDAAVRDEFNRRIREFIGSHQHLEMVAPFGITEAELPGTLTVKELCRP